MTRRRYVQIDGELVEVGEGYVPEPRRTDWRVMPDIQPYRSMADGSLVTSRSVHREMLRRNNCIEIGNDSSLHKPRQPLQSPPGLKETLIRVANEKLRSR